ncbi:unnamed protein product [Parajaminaea phylloscopi]
MRHKDYECWLETHHPRSSGDVTAQRIQERPVPLVRRLSDTSSSRHSRASVTLASHQEYLVRWRRLPSYGKAKATDPDDALQASAWVSIAHNGKVLGEALISDVFRETSEGFSNTTAPFNHAPPTVDRVVSSTEVTGHPLVFDIDIASSRTASSSSAPQKVGKVTVTLHRSPEVLRRAIKRRARSDVINVQPSQREPVAGSPPASVAPTIFTFWIDVASQAKLLQQARSAPSLRHSISITLEKLRPGLGRRASAAFEGTEPASSPVRSHHDTRSATSGVSSSRKLPHGQPQSPATHSQPPSSVTRAQPHSPMSAQASPPHSAMPQLQASPRGRRPSFTLATTNGRLWVAPLDSATSGSHSRANSLTSSSSRCVHFESHGRAQERQRQRAETLPTPTVPSQPLAPFRVFDRNDSDPLSFSSPSAGSGATPSPRDSSVRSGSMSRSPEELDALRQPRSPRSPLGGETPRPSQLRTLAANSPIENSYPHRSRTVSEMSPTAFGYRQKGVNPILQAGHLARVRQRTLSASSSEGNSQPTSPVRALNGPPAISLSSPHSPSAVTQSPGPAQQLAQHEDAREQPQAAVPGSRQPRESYESVNMSTDVTASSTDGDTLMTPEDSMSRLSAGSKGAVAAGFGLLTPVTEEIDRDSVRRMSQAFASACIGSNLETPVPSNDAGMAIETPTLPQRNTSLSHHQKILRDMTAGQGDQTDAASLALRDRDQHRDLALDRLSGRSGDAAEEPQQVNDTLPALLPRPHDDLRAADSRASSAMQTDGSQELSLKMLLDQLAGLRQQETYLLSILRDWQASGTLSREVQQKQEVIRDLTEELLQQGFTDEQRAAFTPKGQVGEQPMSPEQELAPGRLAFPAARPQSAFSSDTPPEVELLTERQSRVEPSKAILEATRPTSGHVPSSDTQAPSQNRSASSAVDGVVESEAQALQPASDQPLGPDSGEDDNEKKTTPGSQAQSRASRSHRPSAHNELMHGSAAASDSEIDPTLSGDISEGEGADTPTLPEPVAAMGAAAVEQFLDDELDTPEALPSEPDLTDRHITWALDVNDEAPSSSNSSLPNYQPASRGPASNAATNGSTPTSQRSPNTSPPSSRSPSPDHSPAAARVSPQSSAQASKPSRPSRARRPPSTASSSSSPTTLSTTIPLYRQHTHAPTATA